MSEGVYAGDSAYMTVDVALRLYDALVAAEETDIVTDINELRQGMVVIDFHPYLNAETLQTLALHGFTDEYLTQAGIITHLPANPVAELEAATQIDIRTVAFSLPALEPRFTICRTCG